MNTMTLGEKITYLATEFHKNPQPFVAAFKATCTFTHSFRDLQGLDDSDDEFIESSTGGQVLICTGKFNNKLQNERWHWAAVQDDLLMFSPQSTYNPHLYYQVPFGGDKIQFDNFLTHDYTEEEMFQYSTTLSNGALETLEAFVYLKDNCTIPFKINLAKVNLDLAVEVYKQWQHDSIQEM